ncbi:cupin domain-containing protein [Methylocella sp.]|uniref:cupin domain-containing protein n=1 Tax=Methylocella sp. TaxID=1978226 RepID=UPI003784D870
MTTQKARPAFARFDPLAISREFPPTAKTLLLDTYLTDEPRSSARVFRVYRGAPAHYHEGSDEYLYVLSGRGAFWMNDPSDLREFRPDDLLFFRRRIVHALPDMLEEPIAFLSVDAPRRDPKDIVFVDPKDGAPESFIGAAH